MDDWEILDDSEINDEDLIEYKKGRNVRAAKDRNELHPGAQYNRQEPD